MRITKVTIENFGIYKDLCEFQFNYDQKKKVTLFKGKNGSGKTTLLNSIKTALYGSMIYGSRKSENAKYVNFISNVLNKDALKNPSSRYFVEIALTANLQKFSGTMIINRSWKWNNSKVVEETSMLCNGQRLSMIEIDEFFDILYRLYPLELFELFYLDGEKIDQLSFFSTDLYSLIESSMNIDLFKTLKNDLETYAVKKHNNKKLDDLKNEKNYCIELLENIKSTKSSLNNEVGKLTEDEHLMKDQINSISKEITESDENLPQQIQQKNYELRDLKKKINKNITEILPLILLEKEIDQLSNQLSKEEENNISRIIKSTFDDNLKKYISESNKLNLDIIQLDILFNIVHERFSGNTKIIHELNPKDLRDLQILFARLSAESKEEIKVDFENYIALQKDQKSLNESFLSYDAGKIEKLVKELLESKSKLSNIQNNIKLHNDKLFSIDKQIVTLSSKIAVLDAEIWKAIKSENVHNVVGNMKYVLDKYIETVKQRKIVGIEKYAKEMFETLIRKKGFIQDIKINSEGVFLVTGDGNKMLVSNLSSGEKQLFVLSIIYALFKVSERSTPMIFDTLFGRLDKNHQQEVMSKFIASCPDQVIILATDSELENIKSETLNDLINTIYSIDLSKDYNRIEMIS
ncbi:DNA sulfur modification protein DndD [Proteiniclasticum sp. BAD-10]|uniref:Nuclease SbcCD subunit C n=1 Tax=Proteiniclasticum sediminis TaxID=2804028 RepID=A0A941HS74_9CLOT|nr:DNA sulfur modification protein DndD [Proteiniclasticum sediminis]MBR0576972.1 DNA sulfur modification protein DndD [Proteiniclasticum sediminis]